MNKSVQKKSMTATFVPESDLKYRWKQHFHKTDMLLRLEPNKTNSTFTTSIAEGTMFRNGFGLVCKPCSEKSFNTLQYAFYSETLARNSKSAKTAVKKVSSLDPHKNN